MFYNVLMQMTILLNLRDSSLKPETLVLQKIHKEIVKVIHIEIHMNGLVLQCLDELFEA